jgi:hypothetical protein
MNEQIKQLWSEAAESTIGDSWEEQTKFLEKFAELIVFECIKIAVFKGDSATGKAIKEWFGVEE